MQNEEIKDSFKAKGLKKAKETLDYLKMSDEERWRYERYQSDLHHQASLYESTFVIGKIEGYKEGVADEQKKSQLKLITMVKKLAKKGLAIADIAEISGMDRTEIKDILSQ